MPKKISYIECELKLWYLTISWKSEWVRGSLNVKRRRGGSSSFGIPGGRGGGEGKKNQAFCHGGVDFF